MKSKKSPKNKNWKILIGIGAVLLVVLIIFTFSDSDFTGTKLKNKKAVMTKTSDPTKKGQDGGFGQQDGEIPLTDDGTSPEMLLEYYKEWAKYPPYSRPLTSDNYDLIYPFKVDNSPIIMLDDEKKEANGYRCLMQPKTWAAIGGKEMVITLECRDSSSVPVKIKINNFNVFREWEGKQYPTHSADVNDDGRDGDEVAKDNIHTFRWRPMIGDWGQMSLEANILYGRENKNAKVNASFFSSPNKPAEFSNFFRDMIVDGSLVIKAEVRVIKPGNYHLEANLKESEGGNFVAYATYDGQLKGGSNEVDFIFFGKVLRDRGYDGPYILTAARGHRVNLAVDPAWFNQGEEGLRKIQSARTTEPDRELVVPYTEEFKTKPYTLSSFSKNEWQSEDKTKRIQELQNLK